MKNQYPDKPNARGIPLTGLSNARPETKAIEKMVRRNIEGLPFSFEYIKHPVKQPFNQEMDPGFGDRQPLLRYEVACQVAFFYCIYFGKIMALARCELLKASVLTTGASEDI